MHCGVERSLHTRFRGDRPNSLSVIDVTDRQTDRSDFIDIKEIQVYRCCAANDAIIFVRLCTARILLICTIDALHAFLCEQVMSRDQNKYTK